MKEVQGKLFNFRPAAFAAVFLCLGVFFGAASLLHSLSPLWLLAALPLTVTPFFFCKKEKLVRFALAVGMMIVCFFLGYGTFTQRVNDFQDATNYYGGEYTVTGKVDSYTQSNYGVTLHLSDIRVGGNAEKGKLVAYLPVSFAGKVADGNRVLLKGEVERNELIVSTGEGNFYALGDDLRYVMQASECKVIERPYDFFSALRAKLKERVYAGMDETSAAVTVAVLTGDDSGIDYSLLANMRYGGIAHVFAISGSNIGALFAFALLTMEKTPLKKRSKIFRFCFATFVLVFYGGVCGFSASVVRSIVVCLSFYFARLVGWDKDFLDALGISALIVVLLRPSSLFEADFQLSFAACLGMALLSRPITKGCYRVCDYFAKIFTKREPKELALERSSRPPNVKERILRWCIAFLAVSLSAQIATAPLSLALFGYLSLPSLLLNFLLVPIISVGFTGLLVCVVIAMLCPLSWSVVILRPASAIWAFLLLFFQTLDYSKLCIGNILVPTAMLVCYYLGLSFVSDKWNFLSKTRYGVAVLCFLASFSCLFAVNML